MASRTRAAAVIVAALALLSVLVSALQPSSRPSLDCPPDEVGLDPDGVARCGAPGRLEGAPALTAGQRLDLNAASAEDLAAVKGVPAALAEALVAARRAHGPFTSWEAVDRVEGVGPARLATLVACCRLGAVDAGMW